MPDVIPTLVRSDRSLLVLSLAVFAAAGVANTAIGTARGAFAAALAIVGVYVLAVYARRVDRRTLALVSVFLWICFLATTGVHVVGPETVAGVVPVYTEAVVILVTALTWATLLGAGSSTAFLGFREYGAGTRTATSEESVIEQEYEY